MHVSEVLCRLTACPDAPPRTVALERAIQIGTGFHGKWYRSQREHWLGSLGFRIRQRALSGIDVSKTDAGKQWNRTHCFPMLFWVAECAGIDDSDLARAEAAAFVAAAQIRRDHPSHGKAARAVLPWILVEQRLRERVQRADAIETDSAVASAYERLAAMRPEFRLPAHTAPSTCG